MMCKLSFYIRIKGITIIIHIKGITIILSKLYFIKKYIFHVNILKYVNLNHSYFEFAYLITE